MSVSVGIWDLRDTSTEEQRALARRADARLRFPRDRFPYRLELLFWPVDRMPYLPGSTTVKARGIAFGRTIVLSHATGTGWEALYLVLHESMHHVRFTAEQMLGMLRLFRPKVPNLPASAASPEDRRMIRSIWKQIPGKGYWWRPYECAMDDLVWAHTKPPMRGPYDGLYRFDTPDPARLAFRTASMRVPVIIPPDEPDEPELPQEPNPDPGLPDPEHTYAELLALYVQEKEAHDACKVDLDAANATIASAILVLSGVPLSTSTPEDGGDSDAPS